MCKSRGKNGHLQIQKCNLLHTIFRKKDKCGKIVIKYNDEPNFE